MYNEVLRNSQYISKLRGLVFVGIPAVVISYVIILLLTINRFSPSWPSIVYFLFVGGGMASVIIDHIYHIPIKVSISETNLRLKYKKRDITIPWDNIKKIIRVGNPKYAPQLKLFLKNDKKKLLLRVVNKEILDKIYNQFQSYKESQKES
ncbi:MAG: hypothetical protein QMC80_05830 [Thermoplasmatales archaeon]|nr:hypothetical protein [Thermoplasmatales archaeon]